MGLYCVCRLAQSRRTIPLQELHQGKDRQQFCVRVSVLDLFCSFCIFLLIPIVTVLGIDFVTSKAKSGKNSVDFLSRMQLRRYLSLHRTDCTTFAGPSFCSILIFFTLPQRLSCSPDLCSVMWGLRGCNMFGYVVAYTESIYKSDSFAASVHVASASA